MAKPPPSPRALFAARLKQARAAAGISSQRALGQMLGLDKKLASSRINRYETQVRGIELDGLGELAATLAVPMSFLVAEDELTAEIILALSKMSKSKRKELLKQLQGQGKPGGTA